MSEPNSNEPISGNDATELVTLRKLRDELLTKTHAQKARIAELESNALQLVEARDNAQIAMRAVVVDMPLKKMAAELNKNLPELVVRELLEDYSFDAAEDGSIVMLTKADSKPVIDNDGKPVEWSRRALHSFLTGGSSVDKTDRQHVYTHLLSVPVGSGSIGRSLSIPIRTDEKKDSTPTTFGLR